MIGVGTEDVDGLSEPGFNLEAISVEGNDLQRREESVGGEEDDRTSGRVLDEHEANESSNGAPQEIETAVLDHHIGFAVDRAGSGGKGRASREVSEVDFLSVKPGASSARDRGWRRGPVGDGVDANPCDEVMTGFEQRPDDFSAGIVGVSDEDGGRGDLFDEFEEEGHHLVQEGAFVLFLENDPFVNP